MLNIGNPIFCYIVAEALAERPRRRRTSSRTRKRTLSGRSISDHSDMETEPFDIDNLLKENKPKSSSHTKKLNGATMEISHDNCDNGDNVSDEFRTELKKFIRDKLFSRYAVSISELKRLLDVKLSESPPGYILGGGVTDRLCEQAVIDIGGIVLNSKWQSEPVFLHVNTGDDLEPLRQAIGELAKTSNKLYKKTVMKNAEAASGMTFSEATVKNVLRDYCLNKNNQWLLKGSVDISS